MPSCRCRKRPVAASQCRRKPEANVTDVQTSRQTSSRLGGKAAPTIREHRIPAANSGPYICVEGPDRALWFCESGAAKIGRFDPAASRFTEFDLPTRNATPIGITVGADGNLWFAEKAANKIGRITPRGDITEFPIPTAGAGPD